MNPIHRILDANLNRAGEAIRTAEEYARFVLDSSLLSARLKKCRHALMLAAAGYEKATGADLRSSRDTPGDVGTGVKTPSEASRIDAAAAAKAAFRRGEEALRVLSEYAKVDNAAAAAEFERIRYELYAVEPLALAESSRREKLAKARLYVLITGSLCSTDPLAAASEAVAGGADVIQMREKDLEDLEFLQLAERMREICRGAGALFIVNDRPHIAQLVDADGVHGGQGDLPAHLIRRFVGYTGLVGRSTSGPEFAEAALAEGADYIGVGPVYETNTKIHRRAVGLEYVRWVAGWNRLPYFCIGSVNRETLDGVLEAGARAVAICTAITKAQDIAAETAYFKERLIARGGN